MELRSGVNGLASLVGRKGFLEFCVLGDGGGGKQEAYGSLGRRGEEIGVCFVFFDTENMRIGLVYLSRKQGGCPVLFANAR